ncbi:MAG: hypothetical protein IJA91_02905 [Clostridia bacterium]|nr:hypothetical protein [Clostridia bacterium]
MVYASTEIQDFGVGLEVGDDCSFFFFVKGFFMQMHTSFQREMITVRSGRARSRWLWWE